MTRLTDIQLILLTTAAQRDDGNLLPVPSTLGPLDDKIHKAIASLIKRGLAADTGGVDAARSWCSNGALRYGAVITDAGKLTIGIVEDAAPDQPDNAAGPAPRPITKQALIIDLLQREHGATLPDLIAATGWLPHTTRAALTGLRKKGHVLAKTKRDDVTCYKIAAAA